MTDIIKRCLIALMGLLTACTSPDFYALDSPYTPNDLRDTAFLLCLAHHYHHRHSVQAAQYALQHAQAYRHRDSHSTRLLTTLNQAAKQAATTYLGQDPVPYCHHWRNSDIVSRLIRP